MGRKVRRSWKRQQRHHLMTLPRMTLKRSCVVLTVVIPLFYTQKKQKEGTIQFLRLLLARKQWTGTYKNHFLVLDSRFRELLLQWKRSWDTRVSCQESTTKMKYFTITRVESAVVWFVWWTYFTNQSVENHQNYSNPEHWRCLLSLGWQILVTANNFFITR